MSTYGNTDYLACALWTSTDEAGAPLSELGHAFAPGVADVLCAEWQAFLALHHERIGISYPLGAHDFWLTRNGHGAGFWDGDWPEPAATVLSDASRRAGERTLYVGDDGLIYCLELPT